MNVISGEKRRIKFDAILTTVSNSQPRRVQVDNVVKWMPATGYVQIVGDVGSVGHVPGLEVSAPSGLEPSVKDAIAAYVSRNSYTEYDTLAFATTNLILNPNPIALFEFLEGSQSGRAWAFYVDGPVGTGAPEFFATTSVVIPHILKSIPGDLTMNGQEWAAWMHEWFQKNLPPHRYLDAGKFGLVAGRLPPIPEPESIFSVAAFANQTMQEVGMVVDDAPRWSVNAVSLPNKALSDPGTIEDTPGKQVPVKTQKKRGRPPKAKPVVKVTQEEKSNGTDSP